MPLQTFEPIAVTFEGAEVEPAKSYTKKTVLEGPIITAEWNITGVLVGIALEYHLDQAVTNKGAYEQISDAITQAQQAETNLAAQKKRQEETITGLEYVVKEREVEYNSAPSRPLFIAYLEAAAALQAARAALEAVDVAVTQAARETAKLKYERAEFGLADAKDALRRSDFPLLIVARLIFEDEVIWVRSLDTQRLLLKTTGRTLAEETGGDYTAVQGLYQERSEARYDINGSLTPGKPLTLELEVLGPLPLEGSPYIEGPLIVGSATLTTPSLAVEYEPERAPNIN